MLFVPHQHRLLGRHEVCEVSPAVRPSIDTEADVCRELEQDLVPEWRAKYLDYKVIPAQGNRGIVDDGHFRREKRRSRPLRAHSTKSTRHPRLLAARNQRTSSLPPRIGLQQRHDEPPYKAWPIPFRRMSLLLEAPLPHLCKTHPIVAAAHPRLQKRVTSRTREVRLGSLTRELHRFPYGANSHQAK